MAKMTRRKLLVTTSTSAVAVGGVAALLRYQTPKASVASTSTDVKAATAATTTQNGPIVAYISDASKGQVSVMVGEREIIVHDPVLVTHLLNIVP